MISCPRAHYVPAPIKICQKLLIEEIAWYCLMPLCNMMCNKPYRNGIMNAPLKWRAPVRSMPSMKVSATATGDITNTATGIENWFERGQSPLSFSVQENKLSKSSARNMMAIKHNTKSANANNAKEAAALASLAWWPCPQSPWSCSAPWTWRLCKGWWLRLPGGGPRWGWKCTSLRVVAMIS